MWMITVLEAGKSVLEFAQSTLGKVIIGLIIIVLLGLYFHHTWYTQGETDGKAEVQKEWDAAKVATEKEISELKAKADAVTVKTEIQYVDRVKTITEKGETIIQFQDRFITQEENKNCIIPNNLVLFHDHSVRNTTPAMKEYNLLPASGVPATGDKK
jgi:hypothetical protein